MMKILCNTHTIISYSPEIEMCMLASNGWTTGDTTERSSIYSLGEVSFNVWGSIGIVNWPVSIVTYHVSDVTFRIKVKVAIW